MGETRGQWTGRILAGKYRVGHRLGRGGVGVVYEAVQQDLRRRVAVKLLHPHLASDERYLARFRREAESAGTLGHPNIVQITDFQQRAGEPPFLVMEYLEGRSLEEELRKGGPMSEQRVSFVAQQVLSALSAAHAAGIVHRDLKPGNIFLTSVAGVSDIVKLVDFGVAKVADPEDGPWSGLTATGETLGTPSYMAPEQAMGEPVDGRADLFTVGVVMYRALTGRLPFDGPSPAAQLQAVVHDEPPPLRQWLPQVDRRLEVAVDRALRKRPEERFEDADAMGAVLEAEPGSLDAPGGPDDDQPTVDEEDPEEQTQDLKPPMPTARRPRKTLHGVGPQSWDEEATRRVDDMDELRAAAAAEPGGQPESVDVDLDAELEQGATTVDGTPADVEALRMAARRGDGVGAGRELDPYDDEIATRPQARPPVAPGAPSTPIAARDEPEPVPQAPTPTSPSRSRGGGGARIVLWSAVVVAVSGTAAGVLTWKLRGSEGDAAPAATAAAEAPPPAAAAEGGEPAAREAEPATVVERAGPVSDAGGATERTGDAADAATGEADAGAAAASADAGLEATADDAGEATGAEEGGVELPPVPASVARLPERRRIAVARQLRSRAHGHFGRGRLERAESVYRKALQYEPDSSASALGLARVLARAGQPAAAFAWASRSAELNPRRPLTHIVLGDIRAGQGDYGAAAEHYREAVRLDPGNDKARKRLWRAKARQ